MRPCLRERAAAARCSPRMPCRLRHGRRQPDTACLQRARTGRPGGSCSSSSAASSRCSPPGCSPSAGRSSGPTGPTATTTAYLTTPTERFEIGVLRDHLGGHRPVRGGHGRGLAALRGSARRRSAHRRGHERRLRGDRGDRRRRCLPRRRRARPGARPRLRPVPRRVPALPRRRGRPGRPASRASGRHRSPARRADARLGRNRGELGDRADERGRPAGGRGRPDVRARRWAL